MSAVERVIDSFNGAVSLSRSQIIENLNELGTLLRDSEVRSNPHVTNSIPQLAKITNEAVKAGDNELLLEVFRVWVNLTADNDKNRDTVATVAPEDLSLFWHNVSTFNSGEDTLKERVILFLTQFIHNTEQASTFAMFFHGIGITSSLLQYVTTLEPEEDVEDTFDSVSNGFELISEITKHVKPEEFWAKVGIKQFHDLVATANKLVILADAEYPVVGEVFDYISNILYNITLVDDSKDFGNISQMYTILDRLPQTFENVTLINRRIFSAVGNITSVPSYDNTKDTELNLSILLHPQNKYSAAAAAIGLGNCIHSQDTKEALIGEIQSRMPINQFVEAFFGVGFGDIIQYQAFHLLNNAMNQEIATVILGNQAILTKLTTINKAIVDNSKYYKEVSQIYFKFLRKLVKFGLLDTHSSDIGPLLPIWQYLDNNENKLDTEEIFLLLFQATALSFRPESSDSAFLRRLVEISFSSSHLQNQSALITVILEKLKTIGITLQTFNKNSITPDDLASSLLYGDQFAPRFLAPYTQLLRDLHESIQANNGPSLGALALQNNCRFVAAATLTWVQGPLTAETTPLVEVCHQILG